jgi:predicted GIY-YIG superfamily endonuclease
MHGVYFLTNGNKRKTYIGYSNCISKRFRTHCLKLAAAAKRTKTFDECHMWAKIEGFPSSNSALSFEFLAKRRKIFSKKKRLKLKKPCPNVRLEKFLAPLLLKRFKEISKHLVLYIHDPDNTWSCEISDYYGIAVKELEPPFNPDHFR